MKDVDVRNTIRELHYNQGMSGRAIGNLMGIPPRTVQDYLAGNTFSGEGKLQYDPKDVAFSWGGVKYDGYSRDEIITKLPPKEEVNSKPLKILIIADTQCKPGEDLSYMSWIGSYINAKKPDVVVHIGDHYDCPSLSSYDKGKKSFEGRRLKADIEAGNKGMELLLEEIKYNPRLVFCLGNHEDRIDRLSNDMPELDGFVGTNLLPLEDMGWEVYPFLKPVEIGGIFFVHYLANHFSGKPYGGTAMNQLKTVGRSFVVGHKQCLDVAIRPTIDGKHQIGIINGACLTPDHKILMADLTYRELGEVKSGDKVISFDEVPNLDGKRSRGYREGKVEAVKLAEKEVFKVTLASGKIFKTTKDHLWLAKVGSLYHWRTTESLRKGTRIPKIMEEWETLKSFDAGWLSGVYDGEGHYTVRNSKTSACMNLGVTQKPGLVSDNIRQVLGDLFGLGTTKSTKDHSNCDVFRIKGGVRHVAKVLGSLRPLRLLEKFHPEHLGKICTSEQHLDTVVSVESLGNKEIVQIAIDHKTMVVEGYGHHNCYPFDEDYKGFQANNHFRGITILHEVRDGFGLPMFVSLDYLKSRYENRSLLS